MRRPPVPRVALIALVALGAGVAGALAFDLVSPDDERAIPPIYISSATGAERPAAPDIIVDGGISTADARRAARAAEARFGGRALSVDRDDGRYEVELQRPDGTIAEALVDSSFIALGLDVGD